MRPNEPVLSPQARGDQRPLRQLLFAPRSVALIGQSDDAGKAAGRPLKYLRQARYAGRIYPINARRDEVLGERAWRSLDALPEVPEHAYIVTAADAAVAAAEACGRAGVAVATLLSDGFAEAGPEGLARETRLREIAAATGMRIVGPSSLGIVDLRSGSFLTANAAFDEPDLPAGRIFAASHSGGMIGTLVSRGKACGIGFAALVSVGNEVDLSLGEICAAMLDDPDIDGFLLFLETLRRAGDLRSFAVRAAAAAKPVLAYKLGRSNAARELAATHTGALAGEDDVAEAFLRDCGIARVETLSALIEGMPVLARLPARRERRTPRVAVVTTTAGGAAMVVDSLASRGVEVAQPSEALYRGLDGAGIKVARARLVDLTLAGVRYDVMKAALGVLTAADEFDLVVVVVGSSARFYPELAVRPIVDSAGAGKPVAVFLVPEAPQARALLGQAGVANFYTPEACADAVAAALTRRPPRVVATFSSAHALAGAGAAPLASPSPSLRGEPLASPSPRLRGEGRGEGLFPQAQARGCAPSPGAHSPSKTGVDALLMRADPGSSPGQALSPQAGRGEEQASTAIRTLDELEAYALLDRIGVARAPSIAIDADAAAPAALPFAFPVALKLLSSEITHKSDVGGVVLGIADAPALAAAVVSMRSRLPQVRRFLVQPMIGGVGEALIGYRIDSDVGPLVMAAAGGMFTEIYRDRTLRLAPVDLDTAREMIAQVRGFDVFGGYRGRPAGDLAALAQAIVAISQLAAEPSVVEAEVNPLIVRREDDGVMAADAVVRVR